MSCKEWCQGEVHAGDARNEKRNKNGSCRDAKAQKLKKEGKNKMRGMEARGGAETKRIVVSDHWLVLDGGSVERKKEREKNRRRERERGLLVYEQS